MLQWTTGQYEVLRDLGSGTFGSVSLVRDRFNSDRLLALKRYQQDRLSPESLADLRQQILRLRQVRHANLAWIHDAHYVESTNTLIVTTDYIDGTTVLKTVESHGRECVQDLVLQVLRALKHVHRRKVFHNDIKPSNVLVSSEEGSLRVRLVDFVPCNMQFEALADADETSRRYAAPERLQGAGCSPASDLYSVGVLLRELLDLTATVVSRDERGPHPLRRVVERLCAADPRDRPATAEDAMRAISAETDAHLQSGAGGPDSGLSLTGHFVGRTRELRQLEDVARRVLHGEGGSLVLLDGEPGMGKTRLLDELRVVAQLSGIRVVTSTCRSESGAPLAPVADLLRQIAMTLQSDHPAVVEHGAVLSSILPGITSPDDARDLPELPPDQNWMRIKNSLAEFLAAAGAARPILLIIDDFQWIDEASLSLVDSLAASVAGLPVLIIGAFARSLVEQAGAAPSLCTVLGSPDREIVHLGPLEADDVSDLVASVFSLPDNGDEISGLLTRLTNGVPLYVEEMIRSFVKGDMESFASERQLIDGHGASGGAPGEVTRLLHSRIDRLPATAKAVLCALTIFERPVSVEAAGHVADVDRSSVRDAVKVLEEHALVWVTRFVDGLRVEIRNDLFRGTVAATIDHLDAVAYHDRALQHLQGLEESGVVIRCTELAYHALRGSALRPALKYATCAAREASSLHAYDKARRFWWTALEKAQELRDQASTAQILSSMAETQERLGDLEGALDSLKRLHEITPDDVPALVRLGDLHRLQGRYDEAEETLKRARALAGGFDDPLLKCRVERAIANCMYRRGRYTEALGRLEQAAKTLTTHEDRLELARTYTTIGLIHWYHGDLDDALDSHKQALALYLLMRDHVGVATSHVNMGLVYWNRGRLSEALNRYCRAEKIARRVGHYLILAVSLHNRGIIEFEQGHLQDARRTLAAGLQMRGRLADKAGQAKAMDTLGLVHLHSGRFREALRLIEDSISWRNELDDRQGVANSRVNLGLVNLEIWNLGKAKVLFEQAAQEAEDMGTRSILAEALLGLAETALRENRVRDAWNCAWRARRIYRVLGQEPDIAQCELVFVRLALERGHLGFVRRRLARAMHRLHRSGTAWLVTQGRQLCGVVRGAQGGLCSLEGALRRAERHGFKELSWRACLGLGRILWEGGRKQEAGPVVRRGMEILRELCRELDEDQHNQFLSDPDKQRLRRLLHRTMSAQETPVQ